MKKRYIVLMIIAVSAQLFLMISSCMNNREMTYDEMLENSRNVFIENSQTFENVKNYLYEDLYTCCDEYEKFNINILFEDTDKFFVKIDYVDSNNIHIRKDPIEIKGDIIKDLTTLKECGVYSIYISEYWALNEKDLIKSIKFKLYCIGDFNPHWTTIGVMYTEEVPANIDLKWIQGNWYSFEHFH